LILSWLVCASTAAAAADAPLLRVGERALSVEEAAALTRRLPPLTRPAAGADVETLRAFVDRTLLPYFLTGLYAADQYAGKADFRHVRDAYLAQSLEDALRREINAPAGRDALVAANESAGGVSEEAVKAYYEKHLDQFSTKEGLLLSRVLLNTQEQAKTLLAQLTAQGGLAQWSKLTRELSLDTATKWRDGSLGFVRADGTTDVPQVSANPALFQAAKLVHDGELVPQPVPEGSYFAVVWRRGTRQAEIQSLASARGAIRHALERAEVGAARTQLLAKLRAERLADYHPELIEATDYPKDPGIPLAKVPLVPHPAELRDKPQPGDQGER
jgi:PPIC-type PPIASE domain